MEQLSFWPEETVRVRALELVRSRLEPHHGMHEAVWGERETPMPLEVFLVRVADLAPSERDAEMALGEHARRVYARRRDEARDVRSAHVLVEHAVRAALPMCLSDDPKSEVSADVLRQLAGARARTGEELQKVCREMEQISIRHPLVGRAGPSYVALLSARWAVQWAQTAREEIEQGVISRAGERSPCELAAELSATVFAQAGRTRPLAAFESACRALAEACWQEASVDVTWGSACPQ